MPQLLSFFYFIVNFLPISSELLCCVTSTDILTLLQLMVQFLSSLGSHVGLGAKKTCFLLSPTGILIKCISVWYKVKQMSLLGGPQTTLCTNVSSRCNFFLFTLLTHTQVSFLSVQQIMRSYNSIDLDRPDISVDIVSMNQFQYGKMK